MSAVAGRPQRITTALLLCATVFVGLLAGPAQKAAASATDCLSYGYGCTPGYSGANAAGTWAWKYYGGGYAVNANGYHNCTLYVAWRLAENGLGDPGNWGNAAQWESHLASVANHQPAVGAVAWWGDVDPPYGHVAYVDQVNGGEVHIVADNYAGSNSNGYTDSGWIPASSVEAFLHPHDLSASTGFEAAFQANTTNMYTYSSVSGPVNTTQGMMPGTSPSITELAGGGYEEAFQANTGSLITFGDAGNRNWGLGMMAGSSPSITALRAGGFEVAFEANTTSLWTVGEGPGSYDQGAWGLGMMRGTSPAITGLAAGGYEVAFEANTTSLWTVGQGPGSHSQGAWGLGMMPGTNPAITGLTAGGYEVAFEANTTSLWTVGQGPGSHSQGAWGLGMMPGTDPAITGLAAGGYEVAFEANTTSLWAVGQLGGSSSPGDLSQGMMRGTSPAIASLPGGGYETAFQANTGMLIVFGSGGNVNTAQGMFVSSSPAIAS